jgi:predicted RNase H-like HicB family nuclease
MECAFMCLWAFLNSKESDVMVEIEYSITKTAEHSFFARSCKPVICSGLGETEKDALKDLRECVEAVYRDKETKKRIGMR